MKLDINDNGFYFTFATIIKYSSNEKDNFSVVSWHFGRQLRRKAATTVENSYESEDTNSIAKYGG